jgi:hypothetical protein
MAVVGPDAARMAPVRVELDARERDARWRVGDQQATGRTPAQELPVARADAARASGSDGDVDEGYPGWTDQRRLVGKVSN